jgi:hypothetical protein
LQQVCLQQALQGRLLLQAVVLLALLAALLQELVLQGPQEWGQDLLLVGCQVLAAAAALVGVEAALMQLVQEHLLLLVVGSQRQQLAAPGQGVALQQQLAVSQALQLAAPVQ